MIYLMIIAAVCAAEVVIRHRVRKSLTEHEVRERSDCPVRLHRYHNYGLAGSRLQEKPALAKALGAAAVAVLTAVFLTVLPLKGRKGLKAGLALVLGGGLANLSERFLHGYVTDYVQFQVPVRRIRRLIFNVADFCIFAGGILMLFAEVLNGEE